MLLMEFLDGVGNDPEACLLLDLETHISVSGLVLLTKCRSQTYEIVVGIVQDLL